MGMEQLVAGFFWGMVAMGFFMYAKTQRDPGALVVAILLTVFTYVFKTFISISVAEVITILAFYLFKRSY